MSNNPHSTTESVDDQAKNTSVPATASRRAVVRTIGAAGASVLLTAPAAEATESGGNMKWRYETQDRVRSSPTVVDGTVYIGSRDGNVYALGVNDGARQWSFPTGAEVRSSPNVVDGTVYVGSFDENVYALHADTGAQQWVFETGGRIIPSPTVVDGTVYIGSFDDNVYALDADNGAQRWTFKASSQVVTSPSVVNGTVYIGSTRLHALDADTGAELWGFDPEWGFPTATVFDNTVYVGTEEGNVFALDAETGDRQWGVTTDSDLSGKVGVQSPPTVVDTTVYVGSGNKVHALDVDSGSRKWSSTYESWVWASPTVAAGRVFLSSADHRVYALDAATGEEYWRFQTGSAVGTSPTVVGGTVYIGGWDGNVYALDAGIGGHSEDSRVLLGTLGHHHIWAEQASPIEEVCVDLIAEQDIDAGLVCVINDADAETLDVTYTASGNWELIETHLAIGDNLEEYEDEGWVTRRGHPRPGRFPYSDDHGSTDEVTYSISLTEIGAEPEDTLVIAAKAVVEREFNDELQEETAWGDGEQFTENGWAMYFEYEVQ